MLCKKSFKYIFIGLSLFCGLNAMHENGHCVKYVHQRTENPAKKQAYQTVISDLEKKAKIEKSRRNQGKQDTTKLFNQNYKVHPNVFCCCCGSCLVGALLGLLCAKTYF